MLSTNNWKKNRENILVFSNSKLHDAFKTSQLLQSNNENYGKD
jgi:hypothetical protein